MRRWSRLPLLLLLGLALAIGLHSGSRAAVPKLKVKVVGLPEKPPKDGRTRAVVVSFEDASVLSRKRAGKEPKKLSIRAPAVPSMMDVTYLSARKHLVLNGVSHAFPPPLSDNVKTKVKLQEVAPPEPVALAALAPLALAGSSQAAGGRTRIGVPTNGFTASGPGVDATMAAGEADMTKGDVVGRSPCYDEDGGVVIVEVDPTFMEARSREMQLCADGYLDLATCIDDQYVPPDHSIDGSLVSDGSQLDITLNYRDPDGNVIATESASGSIDDWFDIHDKVVKKLVKDLCGAPVLAVTDTSCESSSCDCCMGDPMCQGRTYLPQVQGEASGPVGTRIDVNMLAGYGVIACGGWSEMACSPILCCERTSLEQPDHIVYSAQMPFPPTGDCLCPTPDPFDYPVVVQIVAGEGDFTDEKDATPICQ